MWIFFRLSRFGSAANGAARRNARLGAAGKCKRLDITYNRVYNEYTKRGGLTEMVKVRCPKCGTIFPPEAREVQICPNCGCVMRVTRRSAAKRYITDRRDDGYRPQQPPRLPERSGGVYLSREEYEDLLYKARARREHRVDRGYYDGYAEDYTGIAPPEYDTPREVYDYRRDRGYPPAGRAPEPAPQPEPTPAPQPEPTPAPQPAEEQPAPVNESAPQPEQAPCDMFACDPAAPRPFGSSVYDGPDYGRPPVEAPAPVSDIFRSAPVPSASAWNSSTDIRPR